MQNQRIGLLKSISLHPTPLLSYKWEVGTKVWEGGALKPTRRIKFRIPSSQLEVWEMHQKIPSVEFLTIPGKTFTVS